MTIPVNVEEKPIHNRAALNYLLTKKSERPKLVYVPTIGSCERVRFSSETAKKTLAGISVGTLCLGGLFLIAGFGGVIYNSIGQVNYEEIERLNTLLTIGGVSTGVGLGTALLYGLKRIYDDHQNEKIKPDNGRLAAAFDEQDPTSEFAQLFLDNFNLEGCSEKYKRKLIDRLSFHRDKMIEGIERRDDYGYSEREGLGALADFLLETRDGYQRGASQSLRNSYLLNLFASNVANMVKESEGKPKKVDSLQLLKASIEKYNDITGVNERGR